MWAATTSKVAFRRILGARRCLDGNTRLHAKPTPRRDGRYPPKLHVGEKAGEDFGSRSQPDQRSIRQASATTAFGLGRGTGPSLFPLVLVAHHDVDKSHDGAVRI
jgi:hypothetical protein